MRAGHLLLLMQWASIAAVVCGAPAAGNFAYVVVLDCDEPLNDGELLGVRVLRTSLAASGTTVPLLAFVEESMGNDPRLQAMRKEGVLVSLYARRQLPDEPRIMQSLAGRKLLLRALLWQLQSFDRVVMLEPHHLVLRPLDGLFGCGPFCTTHMNPLLYYNDLFVVTPGHQPSLSLFMRALRRAPASGLSQRMLPLLYQAVEEAAGYPLDAPPVAPAAAAELGEAQAQAQAQEQAQTQAQAQAGSEAGGRNGGVFGKDGAAPAWVDSGPAAAEHAASFVRRLPMQYAFSHLMYYEKMNFNLFRCDVLCNATVPALSISYGRVPVVLGLPFNVWYWWSYGYFNLHFLWWDARATLGEGFFWTILIRCITLATVMSCLHTLGTPARRALGQQLYTVLVLREAHPQEWAHFVPWTWLVGAVSALLCFVSVGVSLPQHGPPVTCFLLLATLYPAYTYWVGLWAQECAAAGGGPATTPTASISPITVRIAAVVTQLLPRRLMRLLDMPLLVQCAGLWAWMIAFVSLCLLSSFPEFASKIVALVVGLAWALYVHAALVNQRLRSVMSRAHKV